jgi:hypothetical protein
MNTRILRTITIAAACGVIGAGAGIAGAGAHEGQGQGKGKSRQHADRGWHLGAPVHAELVVPDRQGGFQTVTLDRGAVKSVSGDQLTITEGTRKATYKDVTLTVPATAKIRRNGDSAQLSDLQAGDLVTVVTTGDTTVVKAKAAGERKAEGFKKHKD